MTPQTGRAKGTVEYLTLEDALVLIDDLQVGPVRDIGLLESALHRPTVAPLGQAAYPDLETKAAVLLESIVRNHALIDGNKRLGWLCAVVFMGLNDIDLEAPDDDAYDLIIGLAEGRLDHAIAAGRIATWMRPMPFVMPKK